MTKFEEHLKDFANMRLDDCYEQYSKTENYITLENAYDNAMKALRDTLTDRQKKHINEIEDAFTQREGYSMVMAYLQGLKDGLRLSK